MQYSTRKLGLKKRLFVSGKVASGVPSAPPAAYESLKVTLSRAHAPLVCGAW